MRFIVIGAGAIGGLVGGRLFESGHDVVLVARGDHLQALQADGLTVADPDRTVTLPIPAVGSVGEIGIEPGDAVLLAVKGQDTVGVLDELRLAAAGRAVSVACLQNGVRSEREALRRFPDVHAVCVMCPATHLQPGRVEAASAPVTGLLDVGRFPDAEPDERTRALAQAFTASTFASEPRADIMRWKYRKLMMNLGNVVEALCAPGEAAGALVARLVVEGEQVLAAAGIDLVSAEDDAARRGDLIRLRRVEGRRREGGSTWQSLRRGTGSLETDHLNGEVVLLGRLHGVPTPANALLQGLAARAAAEGWEPGRIDPLDVIDQLGRQTTP